MSDLPTEFEAAARELARDRIASERVTTLRPDMEPRERVRQALQVTCDAIATLEMLADEVMLNGEQLTALEEAESRLALMRPRVKMRRSMLYLAGVFGRAP